MTHPFARAIAATLVPFALAGCCTPVDAPPAKPAATKPAAQATAADDKTISLFDGKTLKNWKSSEFGGDAEPQVEDGKLIVGVGATLSGVTYTGPALPKVDYEIELDAQKLSGDDFFVGLTFPYKDNFATLVLGGWGGGLVGISSVDNMDAANNDTGTTMNFERKKWYHVKVRATDKKIEAWVDNEQVVNLETEGKKIDLRVDIENARPFGLATYQTAAGYKNIVVRKL